TTRIDEVEGTFIVKPTKDLMPDTKQSLGWKYVFDVAQSLSCANILSNPAQIYTLHEDHWDLETLLHTTGIEDHGHLHLILNGLRKVSKGQEFLVVGLGSTLLGDYVFNPTPCYSDEEDNEIMGDVEAAKDGVGVSTAVGENVLLEHIIVID
ncbi:hypothetical protein KI387_005475, partial [Taxus chinensis]